ncbi:MAG: hypothetical protein IPM92_04830 [Saprospiraceae bacterium]|nr:hypothetical protein [Saprospiraceae bacterium]
MHSNSSHGFLDPGSDLAGIFANQAANYYRNPNSKWILFNVHSEQGNRMMQRLENLSSAYFDKDGICYGGELYPEQLEENTNMLYHLMHVENKTVILAGAGAEWIAAVQKQWSVHYNPYRLSIVSDKTLLTHKIQEDCMYLKEMHFLGLQRHFLNPGTKGISQSIRLGELRNNASCADPYIRSSEFIYFDLNAVRAADCPATTSQNPSGLYAEEAAALSRMAGMSDRNKCFVISDWNSEKDERDITAELVAQMVWYFWEGCHLKQLDQALQRHQLTNYQVHLHNIDYVLNFYKSEQSGKWWFEEPLVDNEFSNQLIPCSYEEYMLTAKDQIPKRILEKING